MTQHHLHIDRPSCFSGNPSDQIYTKPKNTTFAQLKTKAKRQVPSLKLPKRTVFIQEQTENTFYRLMFYSRDNYSFKTQIVVYVSSVLHGTAAAERNRFITLSKNYIHFRLKP